MTNKHQVNWLKSGQNNFGQINFRAKRPVTQRVDKGIHWLNFYPADNTIVCPNSYPLDSDLSGG